MADFRVRTRLGQHQSEEPCHMRQQESHHWLPGQSQDNMKNPFSYLILTSVSPGERTVIPQYHSLKVPRERVRVSFLEVDFWGCQGACPDPGWEGHGMPPPASTSFTSWTLLHPRASTVAWPFAILWQPEMIKKCAFIRHCCKFAWYIFLYKCTLKHETTSNLIN